MFQPGCVNTTELDIKKACRSYKPLSESRKHLYLGIASSRILPNSESHTPPSMEVLCKEIETLKARLDRSNTKVSKVSEA